MALSAALAKLNDLLSCVTYNGAKHSHVLIEECDALSALKKVILMAPSGDWFSFNPDKGRACQRTQKCPVMSPLLSTDSHHKHHRACDCVVVVHRQGQLTVAYIDLKSKNKNGYADQFKSTRQFMRYALGLLEEFHQERFEIQERYIILHGGKAPSLPKTPTVPKTRKTTPEHPYKRQVQDGAKLYLKELLASNP